MCAEPAIRLGRLDFRTNGRGPGLSHARSLQRRHENKADDYEQAPRRELAEVHDLPAVLLVRILPGAQISAKIFGKPNKEPDQEKAEHYGHLSCDSNWFEFDDRPRENGEYDENDKPSVVTERAAQKEV